MISEMSIDEMKVLWVVGALERLASLGMIGPDIPLRLSSDAIDTYMEIDNRRNLLFESDFEIAKIFDSLTKTECDPEPDSENIDAVVDLILQYKNERTDLVRFALSHQTA